jgi:Hemerythrin HHE cation binding domain
MRSLAEQTTDELGGTWSVLERQKRDHVTLDRLLHRVDNTVGDEQEDVLQRIYRLVFSHAFAEEAVLWPALRRSVPNGEELTTQVEREHQEITETVAELERTDRGDPARPGLLQRTLELLRQDVRDEEDDLLPRLQQALDPQQLRRLGMTWELVRRTAPTRTHPIVARRPPGNVLAALPLSAIDRARDSLDRASRRTPSSRSARVLRPASRGLGALAHRIEHLPPLRRGERSETRVRTDEGDG